MIGTHKVLLYGDRTAGAMTQVLPNPGFTTDRSGWQDTAWGQPWTWQGDGTVLSNPLDVYCGLGSRPLVVRPPAADTYQVRVKVRTQAPLVRCNVYVGFASDAAATDWVSRYIGLFDLQPGAHELVSNWVEEASGPAFAYVGADVHFANNPQVVPPGPGDVIVDSIELRVRDTTPAIDLTCLVDQVAIRHGRESSGGQPEAASATFDFTTDQLVPMPPEVDIGALLVVSTTAPGPEGDTITSTRFSGLITDVGHTWEDLGEDTPDHPVTQVVAVSPLGDLGRRIVGDAPWPAELDGARVSRILGLAGAPPDPLWSDPGTVQVLARDVDAQPALELAQNAANSAGGLVWHTRTGEVRYADANHRRGAGVALALDACDLLVAPTWLKNLAGLVNDVSVRYGVAPEGGEQPEYRASNAASIAARGRYGASISTELATLTDATALGQMLLVRNSAPVWVLSALPVAVKDLDEGNTRALLALELGSLLSLSGLPAVGAAPTSVLLWVEGWTETLTWGDHAVELYASGYCRTSPPPRWDDTPPAMTWDQAPGTWDDAACLGPQPNLGRWDDQPATLRWDQVPAAKTWDTYT